MEHVFINEAFDSSIKDFIKLQKSNNEIIANSFAIMVLKILACLYGEIDIINPYIVKNEKSFKYNITKFGYSIDLYENFKKNYLEFYKIEKENQSLSIKKSNPYFVLVQKNLIDMFMVKKKNYSVSIEEENQFFDLLYTSKTMNPLRSSYNYLTAKDIYEVEEYFYECLENLDEKPEPPKKNNVLNVEAYEILNYSLTDIANMDFESVEKINENVYEFFNIDEEAANKSDLLNTAVENYKRYNTRLTSGNGYVDILLVMGIVVTGILVLTVMSFIIL